MSSASKPLFRWTFDPARHDMGVLKEAVARTTAAFGRTRFDWMVCNLAPADFGWLAVLHPYVATAPAGPGWTRLRPDAHEVVADADVVFCGPAPGIVDFLKQPSRGVAYGLTPWGSTDRHQIIDQPPRPYSAAVVGLPPGLDIAAGADVLAAVLATDPFVVGEDEVIPAHPRGVPYKFHSNTCYYRYAPRGDELGFRFARGGDHEVWGRYKNSLVKFK